LQPANTQLFGITALVDASTALFLFGVANGPPGVPGLGVVQYTVPVPSDPLLDGIDVYNQIIVFDTGWVGGIFSATRGMRFRTCRL